MFETPEVRIAKTERSSTDYIEDPVRFAKDLIDGTDKRETPREFNSAEVTPVDRIEELEGIPLLARETLDERAELYARQSISSLRRLQDFNFTPLIVSGYRLRVQAEDREFRSLTDAMRFNTFVESVGREDLRVHGMEIHRDGDLICGVMWDNRVDALRVQCSLRDIVLYVGGYVPETVNAIATL